MLSRPNGELTRAGQCYYQLIGRPPPSRQYDRNQPLIREGPNDYIMLRGGAKKLLRSPSGPEPEGVRARAARESLILELSDETYYLDATREWTFSQQAMQVVDDQVVVDTVLDQPLVALRDVSYQLFCGDEILESAFEQRPDKLCVARQLAELMRLPVQEVLSDFDAITGIGSRWREQGITPRESERFDQSASGAKPRCSTWTARAACWTSTSLRSRSSRAGTATPSSTNPPAPSRGASRSEARRNAGVQGLAGVGGRGRQRPLLRRGPGAGPEGAPGRGALPQDGHAEACG